MNRTLPLTTLILTAALGFAACALPADEAAVTRPATTDPPVTMPPTTLAPVPSHLEGCWIEVHALVIDAGAGAFSSVFDDTTVGRRLDNACGGVEIPEFERLLHRAATTRTRGCFELNALYFAVPFGHWAEAPADRVSMEECVG